MKLTFSLAWASRRVCLVVVAAVFSSGVYPLQRQERPEVGVPNQIRGRKLILKDGSYQIVRCTRIEQQGSSSEECWQRISDRVRYYSVERSAWEEVPAELVDWQATHQAAVDEARQMEEARERIRAAEKAKLTRDLDVDASIEVAPGMFLPDNVGAFVINCLPTGAGEPPRCAIAQMAQVSTESKLDKGRLLTQILSPIPIVPGRHKVSIPGKQAVLRLTTSQPEFYVRTADGREPEMDLIRVRVKGNVREVELISTFLTGEQMSKRDSISIERWQAAKAVYRLTLSKSLDPGEYVLAEYSSEGGLNAYVWDFGVDTASTAGPASKTKK